MKNTLIIQVFDQGDMSVGIFPSDIKITIESNMDCRDVLNDINYKDNRKLFDIDVQTLVKWFTEMPTQVYLEDECLTCGSKLEIDKKGNYITCNKDHSYC